MQPSAGPALPHTRTRAVHWAATAAALTAVLGLSALVQPPDASGAGSPDTRGPDPARARYPVDCGKRALSPPVDVLDSGAADFDGDGRAETVALVRCRAAIGTPPSGIFVLAGTPDGTGRPRVAGILLDPAEGMSVQKFTVRADAGTVGSTLLGYSTEQVPRSSPDQRRKVIWEWRDGRFRLRPAPVAMGA